MSVKFVKCDTETLYLLPLSLHDWLPEGHLTRFVVEMVEQLDLRWRNISSTSGQLTTRWVQSS